jgi:tetratricopeptide (TPR) repeat protein
MVQRRRAAGPGRLKLTATNASATNADRAHALDNLGGVHQRLGRVEEALTEHLEARELAISIGDRAVEAYALNNIGNAHRLAGRLEDATRYQQQARRVADLVIDPNLRTQLYLDRGTTAWARRDDRAALHGFRAALDMAAGTGESAQAARANHRIGDVSTKPATTSRPRRTGATP